MGSVAKDAPAGSEQRQVPTFTVESSTAKPIRNLECRSDRDERCNGLDDNCDGRIDEGCGYRSGPLQFTLAWRGRGDLDLYITDPSGETIFYNEKHRRSKSGGHLDHDARGNCRKQPHPRIENAYWESEPPAGEYRVELHYFGPCRGARQPVRARLAIALGGQIVAVYRYVLQPEDRIAAATVHIE